MTVVRRFTQGEGDDQRCVATEVCDRHDRLTSVREVFGKYIGFRFPFQSGTIDQDAFEGAIQGRTRQRGKLPAERVKRSFG
ncbi:MAG: hypothetical protein U1D30_01675 [Planctomycetota bacterium]